PTTGGFPGCGPETAASAPDLLPRGAARRWRRAAHVERHRGGRCSRRLPGRTTGPCAGDGGVDRRDDRLDRRLLPAHEREGVERQFFLENDLLRPHHVVELPLPDRRVAVVRGVVEPPDGRPRSRGRNDVPSEPLPPRPPPPRN